MTNAKGTDMASGLMILEGRCGPMERLFDRDAGSVAGLDDSALWERFATRRDEAAFAALVERHGSMVLATARGILADHHAAEDVFQATFVALARRGGAIRRFETLGPWLHRVACREAHRVRAKARRQLARERLVEPRSGDPAAANRAEVHAAVHAELDRLPASYRWPIVLCDLEGWTKASAAVHLGWTEGAVRGRLERGRSRLRDRLARQGFAPAALLGGSVLVWGPAASAAARLLPGLIAEATRAALGAGSVGWLGALGSGVVALGPAGARRGVVALGLAGSVGLAGILGWAWSGRSGDVGSNPPPGRAGTIGSAEFPPPRPGWAAPPPAPASPAVGPEQPGELVHVLGQVVNPDGPPIGGAVVRLKPHVGMLPVPAETRVTADAAGRFTLPVPRHLLDRSEWASAMIVAQAPGWGVGYTTIGDVPVGPDGLTIRLVADDAPLEGRIIDLEGNPVAGASVRVGRVVAPTTPDLVAWADFVRRAGVWTTWPEQDGSNQHMLVGLGDFSDLGATTDGDGRFRITGIGRERLAELLIRARHIATTEVFATTQTRGPIVTGDHGRMRPAITIHATRVDLALPPGRAITGVVRDADDGSPIAGLQIDGQLGDEDGNISLPGVEATSDERGAYRLEGLPLADSYRVHVAPRVGQPYPGVAARVAAEGDPATLKDVRSTRAGIKPAVATDLLLRRGLFVRGRVTDKATGRPVVNAAVSSHVLADNPEVGHYPGLARGQATFDRTDIDGKYEVLALPGPGLLTVVALGSAKVVRDFEGMPAYDPQQRRFRTLTNIGNLSFCNAVVPIRFEAGSSPTLDITIEAGDSVRGTIVGPDGQPLAGATAYGLTRGSWPSARNETAEFEAQGLDPTAPRRVFFFHKDRQLGGSVVLRGDEAGPVTVRLGPTCSVVGRLVDERGEPRVGYSFTQIREDHPIPNDGQIFDNHVVTGDDGKFRFDGLLPGLTYRVYSSREFTLTGTVLDDFVPQADGTVEMGEVRPRPFVQRP